MDFCVLKFVKLLIKSPSPQKKKLSLAHLSPAVGRDAPVCVSLCAKYLKKLWTNIDDIFKEKCLRVWEDPDSFVDPGSSLMILYHLQTGRGVTFCRLIKTELIYILGSGSSALCWVLFRSLRMFENLVGLLWFALPNNSGTTRNSFGLTKSRLGYTEEFYAACVICDYTLYIYTHCTVYVYV